MNADKNKPQSGGELVWSDATFRPLLTKQRIEELLGEKFGNIVMYNLNTDELSSRMYTNILLLVRARCLTWLQVSRPTVPPHRLWRGVNLWRYLRKYTIAITQMSLQTAFFSMFHHIIHMANVLRVILYSLTRQRACVRRCHMGGFTPVAKRVVALHPKRPYYQ